MDNLNILFKKVIKKLSVYWKRQRNGGTHPHKQKNNNQLKILLISKLISLGKQVCLLQVFLFEVRKWQERGFDESWLPHFLHYFDRLNDRLQQPSHIGHLYILKIVIKWNFDNWQPMESRLSLNKWIIKCRMGTSAILGSSWWHTSW